MIYTDRTVIHNVLQNIEYILNYYFFSKVIFLSHISKNHFKPTLSNSIQGCIVEVLEQVRGRVHRFSLPSPQNNLEFVA